MNGVRFALLAALSLLVIFISANLVSNVWFRSWRLDLTENQLYSLSPGTKQVLDALNEPVQLTLYYSRDAATVDPDIQSYGARVREMLQSYAGRARGKLRLHEVEPVRFSESEDAANSRISASEAAASSTSAYRPRYSAMIAFTEQLAYQNAEYGIRANVILPGLMNTPMAVDTRAREFKKSRAEVEAERDAKVPLRKKMGTGWDVANAALFLASDEAGFITGVTLPVDGGASVRRG